MNKNIINSQSRYFVCDDKDIIQEFVKGLKKNHKLKNGDYIIIKYDRYIYDEKLNCLNIVLNRNIINCSNCKYSRQVKVSRRYFEEKDGKLIEHIEDSDTKIDSLACMNPYFEKHYETTENNICELHDFPQETIYIT